MKKQSIALFCAITLLAVGGACSKSHENTQTPAETAVAAPAADLQKTPEDKVKIQVTENCKSKTDLVIDDMAWADANNALAIELLKNAKGSTVASAFSAQRCLGMVLDGACGDTAAEMRKALSLPDAANLSEAGQIVENRFLEADKEIAEIAVDNRIWPDAQYELLPEYTQNLVKNYNVTAQTVDFVNNPEQARSAINSHVAKATHDKITDILPAGSLNADVRMVLTNAVYFKAPWRSPFKAQATDKQDFKTANGPVKVDMMHQTKEFGYYQNDSFEAVLMAFNGCSAGFVVILPKLGENADVVASLQNVESTLSAQVIREMIENAEGQEVIMSLPKFRVEATLPLKNILSGLGMKQAFSKAADFTAISGRDDLYVSNVFHKAYIDIAEDGAEAAAATAAVMMMKAAFRPKPQKPVVFNVDHPFVFAIVEQDSGAILFMGRKLEF